MPSQNDNGDRRGPWGGGAKPGSDLEGLVRQGQDRVKQILPSGGLRPAIVLAAIALVGLGAWTAYYTVPSDSVAVVQRFGKYSDRQDPWLDVQNGFVCRRLAADSRKINLHDDDDRLALHINLFSAMGFDLGAIHAGDQQTGAITAHLARQADDWLHAAAQTASADVENDFKTWKE